MTRAKLIAGPLIGLALAASSSKGTAAEQDRTMRVLFQTEKQAVVAMLEDNATTRDFLSLLPLRLTLEDYATTEKISGLPKKLSTEGAPPGFAPQAGDAAYYAPWGNLAIFHKAFRHSDGLVKLGRIEAGLDILARSGPVKVTIERLD